MAPDAEPREALASAAVQAGIRRRDDLTIAVACVVLRLPALISSRWFDPDEAAIAIQAKTIANGGRLYVDIADRKPPVPPLLYAAWFDLSGTDDVRMLRLLAAMLLAVAAVALAHEIHRLHGRSVALWTTALYVTGCYAFVPPDGAAANYAHFAVPVATLAILACRRRGWWPLIGGLLLGLAILCRQSWVFAVPAGALSCWLGARSRGVSLYAIGLCGGVGLAALMAPWTDYWFWNFKSSPGFVFAAIEPWQAISAGAASIALFVVLHLAAVTGAAQKALQRWRADIDLWVWALTGLAAWAAGFRFFGHYWLQVVPPLVILAGPAVAGWSPRRRRAAVATLAIGATLAVVAQVSPSTFHSRPDAEPLAHRVQQCTVASDSVFTWGSFPELLVALDRPVAGGLVHSDFVTGRSGGRSDSSGAETPGAREQMLADLFADPPAVLVDTSTVESLGYEAFPMTDQAELASFLERGGYVADEFNGFRLWWAPDSPCAGEASDAEGH